ncbi:hypothetical protein FACS1894103_3770 [Campylobacterota bacterium]|nr:hypothetical protein FACS1894103_3770 [Campylobacterota bacterium]
MWVGGLLVTDDTFLDYEQLTGTGTLATAHKIVGGYINGVITDPNVIQGMLDTAGTSTWVNYGVTSDKVQMQGLIQYGGTGGGLDRIAAEGQSFNMGVNFFTRQVSGGIGFQAIDSSNRWELGFDGTVNKDGFSGTMAGKPGSGAGVYSSGTIGGKFYDGPNGNTAGAVGGTFQVTSGGTGIQAGTIVDGMFTAKKQ